MHHLRIKKQVKGFAARRGDDLVTVPLKSYQDPTLQTHPSPLVVAYPVETQALTDCASLLSRTLQSGSSGASQPCISVSATQQPSCGLRRSSQF